MSLSVRRLVDLDYLFAAHVDTQIKVSWILALCDGVSSNDARTKVEKEVVSFRRYSGAVVEMRNVEINKLSADKVEKRKW